MTNSEYTANAALAQRSLQRTDWSMRQFVDDIKARLRDHPDHDQLQAQMSARGVPLHVQRRILAGV